MAQPKRLRGISYQGFSTYFVTSVTSHRTKAFSCIDFGLWAKQKLIATAEREKFAISAYCLMPDHAHLLLNALDHQSDLCRMVSAWKQQTGFAWSRSESGKLWQHGYWERVLRDEEETLPIARYVIENPVRAALVSEPAAYELSGSTVFTIEQICAATQMRYRWQR